MEEITFLIINSIFFFFPSLGMNRMSDPLLQDYYDRVAECLLQRAFSLGQFEVNPPEEIFMTVSQVPKPLKELGANSGWDIRKIMISNNHNIRIFYLILLKLCFCEEDCLSYLKRVLRLIFDNNFEIKFPLNRNSDPKLFNSNQFKKLFVDILYHLDMQQSPNIEETIGKYPLIDIVIIYVMRSLLAKKGHQYDYGTALPNSTVFQELCNHFDIPITKLSQGFSIARSYIIFEGFPSFLMLAYKDSRGAQYTDRSSTSKIHAFESDDDSVKEVRNSECTNALPTQSLLRGYSFSNQSGKEQQTTKDEKTEFYPNIFESQVIPLPLQLSQNLNQLNFQKHIPSESRDSINTPIKNINKMVYTPKKMNFADEIRKSTMRVSMLRQTSKSKPKQKVNTQNIFCRESYFGGSPAKQNSVKSNINPSSYQLGTYSNFSPSYSSGISPSKFNTKGADVKPSLFSQYSGYGSDGPLSGFGPRPKESTEQSYYKDFTSSFLLEELPEVTKSSIKSIKKNFMRERSNIRMM